MSTPQQLFIVGRDVLESMSQEDVKATCGGLRQAGLYRLPYPSVSLRFPISALEFDEGQDSKGRDSESMITKGQCEQTRPGKFRYVERPGEWIELIGLNTEGRDVFQILNIPRTTPGRAVVHSPPGEWIEGWLDVLIALLATRNVAKEITEDKLAKLGIGKHSGKHRYRYTTTLTLPARLEPGTREEAGSGRELRAHWRRGHIRNQRFGPKLQFSESKWIEPVFVNADKEFIGERTAYNMSCGRRRLNGAPFVS
jgi:hypothetical protein